MVIHTKLGRAYSFHADAHGWRRQDNRPNHADGAPAAPPWWPRPRLDGPRASRRLRRIVRAWFDRAERWLGCRDYRRHLIEEGLARVTPAQWFGELEKVERQLIELLSLLLILDEDLDEDTLLSGMVN